MVLLKLDEKSSQPKYQQIITQIREKIESRVLRPGEKLPSTRRLAEKLGIHRSTVAIAYQELWSLGYVDLSTGTLPRVRERMKTVAANRSTQCLIDWGALASPANSVIRQTYLDYRAEASQEKSSSLISFRSLDMDYRLFPLENFRTCLNKVIKDHGMELLRYGDSTGYLPLRKYIAHHLQCHGIQVKAAEILITNGSQQGIDLVFRMINAPGRAVAIESPTYDCMLPLLRFSGMKPLEIPISPEGMDLSVLAEKIPIEQPVLIYTMPNFQNPSGVSTSQAHRERLLSLAESHRIPILEDGFEEEMKYFGKEVLPVKSMDKHHLVIYAGTFSKVLFPGVRIGWIAAAEECIERLAAIRRFSEISSSMILQAAIYEFCRSGYYDRHISKMHRVFRKRMHTALRALRQYIPPELAQWNEPNGGYLIWLKLKSLSTPPGELKKRFAGYGVHVAPGRFFFSGDTPDTYLRLSISTLNEDEIIEGVQRLAKSLRQPGGSFEKPPPGPPQNFS